MKSGPNWFLRLLWWFSFVVIAGVVLVLVYRDQIAGAIAEKEIRSALDMDAEIGSLSFGLLEPKATLENFKLYNPADFGGTLFLDVPELHVEYDRATLRRRELHITLLRLDLKELDVVKNEAGKTNIFTIAGTVVPSKTGGGREFAPLNGDKFTGIDVLNVSIGMAKFIDLKNPQRNRAVLLNIQNQILTNVMSPADLAGLESLVWIRGGYLVGLPGSPPKPKYDSGANRVNLGAKP